MVTDKRSPARNRAFSWQVSFLVFTGAVRGHAGFRDPDVPERQPSCLRNVLRSSFCGASSGPGGRAGAGAKSFVLAGVEVTRLLLLALPGQAPPMGLSPGGHRPP